jgi:hypothetical protein
VIEYGSSVCREIDRDSLLSLLGDYESTYIYSGEYKNYGKSEFWIYAVSVIEQLPEISIPETEAPTEKPREPVVVNDSLILVQSGEALSKPYENFLWSKKWIEAGWISGDGMSVSHKFSGIENEIPQITYCDDFEIFYKEGVEFLSFSIYNSNFTRTHHNVKHEVLSDLEEGTYFLIITVKLQGRFIETEEKYEYSGYECVYKIHIAG